MAEGSVPSHVPSPVTPDPFLSNLASSVMEISVSHPFPSPAEALPGPAASAAGAARAEEGVGEAYWLVQREGSFWERGRWLDLSELDRECTLGRSPSCDLQVDDPAVSRLHAALLRRPRRGIYLVDLASREGTYVNGERVQDEVLLMPGDRIRLGPRVVLEFTDGPEPPAGRGRRWLRRLGWMLSGATVLAAVAVLLF